MKRFKSKIQINCKELKKLIFIFFTQPSHRGRLEMPLGCDQCMAVQLARKICENISKASRLRRGSDFFLFFTFLPHKDTSLTIILKHLHKQHHNQTFIALPSSTMILKRVWLTDHQKSTNKNFEIQKQPRKIRL